jgi:hypothetical protein
MFKKIRQFINGDISFRTMIPVIILMIFQVLLVYGPFTHYLTRTFDISRKVLERFEYITVPISVLIFCLYLIQIINKKWLRKDLFSLGYIGVLILNSLIYYLVPDFIYLFLIILLIINIIVFTVFMLSHIIKKNKISSIIYKFILFLFLFCFCLFISIIILSVYFLFFMKLINLLSYANINDFKLILFSFFCLIYTPSITGVSVCFIWSIFNVDLKY